jgi:hypothetical protein
VRDRGDLDLIGVTGDEFLESVDDHGHRHDRANVSCPFAK